MTDYPVKRGDTIDITVDGVKYSETVQNIEALTVSKSGSFEEWWRVRCVSGLEVTVPYLDD